MSRKDHTPTRAKLVLDEVLMGRVEPTKKGVRAHVDDIYTGLMEIERTTIVSAVMNEIRSWKPQEEKKPMTKPKKVLRGKRIVPVAAGYYRANPELTAQECYQAMLRDGHRIEMKASSFEGSGYARKAKKLAESGAELDAPPPTQEPEPEPSKAVPAPAEAAEPEPEPPSQEAEADLTAPSHPDASQGSDTQVEPDPEPDPGPVAVTRTSNGLPVDTGDGDYVRFSLGGQKLDAQREGEEWDVAFEGTVGDGMVRELLGRMFGGSS